MVQTAVTKNLLDFDVDPWKKGVGNNNVWTVFDRSKPGAEQFAGIMWHHRKQWWAEKERSKMAGPRKRVYGGIEYPLYEAMSAPEMGSFEGPVEAISFLLGRIVDPEQLIPLGIVVT